MKTNSLLRSTFRVTSMAQTKNIFRFIFLMMTRPVGSSMVQLTVLRETRQTFLRTIGSLSSCRIFEHDDFVAQPWQDATLRALSFSVSTKSRPRRNWQEESGDHGGNLGKITRTRRRLGATVNRQKRRQSGMIIRTASTGSISFPRFNDSRAPTHCQPVAARRSRL